MFCLEVIRDRNAQPSTVNDNAEGWSVEDRGGGMIAVRWTDDEATRVVVVDASNPLLDGPLVSFHKYSTAPKSIKAQVEGIASQWRRIVSASPAWPTCIADAQWFKVLLAEAA